MQEKLYISGIDMDINLKIRREIEKCANDPIYFISKYIKVVHPIRGLVPFELYPFQHLILDCIINKRFNILRKFRQAGCTTIAAAYSVWMITFKKRNTVAIISKGDAEAVEVLDRIKQMHFELPDFIKVGELESNKHNLKLKNGSAVKSRASGKQAGRSLSANLLIIDEAAFIEQIDTIWAAAYPTLSTGGGAFILSTVNGVGNWYHQMWEEALAKRSHFNAIDINWMSHPEYFPQKGLEHLYIDNWEEITRSNVTPRQWLQEYEANFLGTGDTFIDGEILAMLKGSANKNFVRKYNNRMRVWQDPKARNEYIISVDVSLGRSRDYSAFHVVNVYNGEQVAEFYSNRTPINDFAKIIKEVGYLYNTAYAIIERNTIGNNLIDRLVEDEEYENVWQDEKGLWGFQTTTKSREVLLADLEEFIRMNKIRLNSERVVDELLTFIVAENGKAEADVNCHDDLVMALCLSCYLLKDLIGSTPVDFETSDKVIPVNEPLSVKYNVRSAAGVVVDEDYVKWVNS